MNDNLNTRVNKALADGTPAKAFAVTIVLPENEPASIPEVAEFIQQCGGVVEFSAKLTRSIAATIPAKGILEVSQKYTGATITLDEAGELESE